MKKACSGAWRVSKGAVSPAVRPSLIEEVSFQLSQFAPGEDATMTCETGYAALLCFAAVCFFPAAGREAAAAGLGSFFTIKKLYFFPSMVTLALNVSAFAKLQAAPISVNLGHLRFWL